MWFLLLGLFVFFFIRKTNEENAMQNGTGVAHYYNQRQLPGQKYIQTNIAYIQRKIPLPPTGLARTLFGTLLSSKANLSLMFLQRQSKHYWIPDHQTQILYFNMLSISLLLCKHIYSKWVVKLTIYIMCNELYFPEMLPC